MKKAKIMLLAITVMAVVGGSLAFKAKKVPGFCYYKSAAAAIGNCPLVPIQTFVGLVTSYYTTNDLIEDCPDFSTCTTTTRLTEEF